MSTSSYSSDYIFDILWKFDYAIKWLLAEIFYPEGI